MGRSYLFYLWQMSLLVVVLFSVEESGYVCAIHGAMVYGGWRHFQRYFNYTVAVSFIDGENQSTRRKSLTCRNSLTNFVT